MPVFVSIHQAPALDPDEVAAYIPDIKQNVHAEFQQCFINLEKGFIVTLYEGEDESAVREEFDRIGWPVDSVNEVHFSVDRDGLDAIPTS
ncbi:nickel-binding protein [Microbacterium insulae]|uniref:Nickel-binding protein n=1 Tax=Microbacterium insulae TaxID=483014 RepID=A0ABW3AH67_9MICO